MKTFKIINISSNGSIFFHYGLETSLNNSLICIKKQDDKNFSMNQKQVVLNLDSKHLSHHKKKYLG